MQIMRSLRTSLATAAAVGALAFVPTTFADHHGKDGSMKKDIVDTAVAAGDFKTLAAALQAAGLVETLKGQGPFTVFAPTDAAFAKLPAGTVDSLLKPENKAKLAEHPHVPRGAGEGEGRRRREADERQDRQRPGRGDQGR